MKPRRSLKPPSLTVFKSLRFFQIQATSKSFAQLTFSSIIGADPLWNDAANDLAVERLLTTACRPVICLMTMQIQFHVVPQDYLTRCSQSLQTQYFVPSVVTRSNEAHTTLLCFWAKSFLPGFCALRLFGFVMGIFAISHWYLLSQRTSSRFLLHIPTIHTYAHVRWGLAVAATTPATFTAMRMKGSASKLHLANHKTISNPIL